MGNYEILPGLSGAALSNYLVVTNAGMLTVTQAMLSVTADNQVRAYGSANPVLTGTVAGIQNGDGILASYATVAETNSPVGSYEIVPGVSVPR